MLVLPYLQPQIVVFKIVEIEPEEAVIITKNTSVEFSDIPEGVKKETTKPTTRILAALAGKYRSYGR